MDNTDINAKFHESNMALFVKNSKVISEDDFFALAKENKCALLRVYKPKTDAWTMLYMKTHEAAVKFWRVLDGQTVLDLLNIPVEDSDTYADTYFLTIEISWALNREQKSSLEHKEKKKEPQPILGPRPPIGPAMETIEPVIPVVLVSPPAPALAPVSSSKFVDTQRAKVFDPYVDMTGKMALPTMIPLQASKPPQGVQRPYELRLHCNGENILNCFLTQEQFQAIRNHII